MFDVTEAQSSGRFGQLLHRLGRVLDTCCSLVGLLRLSKSTDIQ